MAPTTTMILLAKVMKFIIFKLKLRTTTLSVRCSTLRASSRQGPGVESTILVQHGFAECHGGPSGGSQEPKRMGILVPSSSAGLEECEGWLNGNGGSDENQPLNHPLRNVQGSPSFIPRSPIPMRA